MRDELQLETLKSGKRRASLIKYRPSWIFMIMNVQHVSAEEKKYFIATQEIIEHYNSGIRNLAIIRTHNATKNNYSFFLCSPSKEL